jgi:tripartite-type tricarboxylate transporter receptor subunit TctC
MAEAGVPGYEVSSWHGLFVPAKTPSEIVKKMSVDTIAALADLVVKGKLQEAGYIVVGSSPDELYQTLLTAEIDKWSAVIKTVGISVIDVTWHGAVSATVREQSSGPAKTRIP